MFSKRLSGIVVHSSKIEALEDDSLSVSRQESETRDHSHSGSGNPGRDGIDPLALGFIFNVR